MDVTLMKKIFICFKFCLFSIIYIYPFNAMAQFTKQAFCEQSHLLQKKCIEGKKCNNVLLNISVPNIIFAPHNSFTPVAVNKVVITNQSKIPVNFSICSYKDNFNLRASSNIGNQRINSNSVMNCYQVEFHIPGFDTSKNGTYDVIECDGRSNIARVDYIP